MVSQGSANCSPQTKSDLLPIFVNKVLLERSHASLSMYGPLPATRAKVSSCNTVRSIKPKVLTIWPYTEEVCWLLT